MSTSTVRSNLAMPFWNSSSEAELALLDDPLLGECLAHAGPFFDDSPDLARSFFDPLLSITTPLDSRSSSSDWPYQSSSRAFMRNSTSSVSVRMNGDDGMIGGR